MSFLEQPKDLLKSPPPAIPPEAGVEECWSTIAGHRMRYLRCGKGSPLLLIHGLLAYSFSWRFTLPALAPYFTCYAVDRLGSGGSDRATDLACDFSSEARRVLQFLDAVGVAQCDVIGTSHGGAVAMTLAAAAPERVRRLVLVAPANPWSAHGRLLAPLLGTAAAAYLLPRLIPCMHLFRHRWMAHMFGDARRIPPDSVDTYAAAAVVPGTFEHVVKIFSCWREDLRELERVLPKIATIPTLLLWGSRDHIVLPDSARYLRSFFRDVRVVSIEGAGHLPYEETPEEFNRAVLEFLKPGS